MTKLIEQEFYKAFDIEPKYYCSYHDCNCPLEDVGKFNKKCPKQAVTKECDARSNNPKYPPITYRILLELEDTLLKQSTHIEYDYVDGEYWGSCEIPLSTSRGKTRKECLLKMLISIANTYKNGAYYDGEGSVYHAVRKIMGVEDGSI